MSNVTLFNPSQVPDFVKRRGGLSEMGKALASGGVAASASPSRAVCSV